jgi:hypothetical protein
VHAVTRAVDEHHWAHAKDSIEELQLSRGLLALQLGAIATLKLRPTPGIVAEPALEL